MFQIGVPPQRIDILTAIDGVEFDDAWPHRTSAGWGTVQVAVIGRSELIRNKRASGRRQDLADLARLETPPPDGSGSAQR